MLRLDFLRTRVARQVLAAFVLGTILPVVLLAAISFFAVTGQLEEQSRNRLQQFTKNAGMSILERLRTVEDGLHGLALARAEGRDPLLLSAPRGVDRLFVAPAEESGAAAEGLPSPLDAEGRVHLGTGKAVLRRVDGPGGPRFWVGVPMSAESAFGPADGSAPLPMLWGRLVESYLWESAQQFLDVPTVGTFCVFDDRFRLLHCASGGEAVEPRTVEALQGENVNGAVDWEAEGEEYLGAFWQIFLPAAYHAPPWTVVVGESRAAVFGPIRSFAFSFPLVLLLGIAVVLLMANVQVRRTMEPLEALTEGTRRIGQRDLSARVAVQRADEFGELADSFNLMADRLSMQFRQLEAGRAIDRAVLEAMERDRVVEAVLRGVVSVLPSSQASMILLESGAGGAATLYHASANGTPTAPPALVQVGERDWMEAPDEGPTADEIPPLLRSVGFEEPDRPLLVFSLRMQGELRGALVVGSADGRRFDEETIARGRQLLDQAAVALDEVRLLRELEDMSWGTLRALARAIDAKSRWTAGHSERVVELSLALGREVGLSERDMETLHRGGLLHDLGKIGVAGEVLDFPGPLSPEARRQMEEHTVIGARILEPVRAFEPVLPIVLSHHERWDGRGYPHRLRGREIHFLARVLAVADTFDALSTSRPYRRPLSKEAALAHIVGESGAAFDPEIVAAFQRLMEGDVDLHTVEEETATHG